MPKRTQARNKPSWSEERATWNGETIDHRVIINIYHYSSIPRQRRVDFPADLPGRQIDGGEFNSEDNLTQAVEFYEKSHIERTLDKAGGDKMRAAELMG
jgi:transcriptional regulator with PAS, ATPase and Fis domain